MPFNKSARAHWRLCTWRLAAGTWTTGIDISPDGDWFDGQFALGNWELILERFAPALPLRGCACCPSRQPPAADAPPVSALELGSWEGNSTSWILSHLCHHKDSVLVAVDNWTYANQGVGTEHEGKRQADLDNVEARFDANVKLASTADGGQGRLEKRKGDTAVILPELHKEGFSFDFCYIDASHAAEDVLRDAVLAWPMIKSGGLIVFDDYGQHHTQSETCPVAIRHRAGEIQGNLTLGWMGLREGGRPEGCQCTGRGVDAFLGAYGKLCEVVDCKYQIVLKKK